MVAGNIPTRRAALSPAQGRAGTKGVSAGQRCVDPVRRYLIDAGQQRAALAAMRAEGQEPVAVFHSHPRTAAAPSGVDVDLAYHPELVYIIVSLALDRPRCGLIA